MVSERKKVKLITGSHGIKLNSIQHIEHLGYARHLLDPGMKLGSGWTLPSLDEIYNLTYQMDNKKYAGSSSMANPPPIHAMDFSTCFAFWRGRVGLYELHHPGSLVMAGS